MSRNVLGGYLVTPPELTHLLRFQDTFQLVAEPASKLIMVRLKLEIRTKRR